jgi:hypothetical protein
MQLLTIIDNPLDPASWETIETEDARAVIADRFPSWPTAARLYDEYCAEDRDVTPRTPGDVERLTAYDKLILVVYPEHPGVLLIIAIAAIVVATAAIILLLPKIPDTNTQTSSSNNSLSERTNKPRPGKRIPDIFGEVRSVPDLLSVPYRIYENDREVEIAYLCIGRGSYAVSDVRDGDTMIDDIAGASVAIYGPYTSPNNMMAPQLQIGTAISDPLFDSRRLNEVNGQTMKAPNDSAVRSDQDIRFADGGLIQAGNPRGREGRRPQPAYVHGI